MHMIPMTPAHYPQVLELNQKLVHFLSDLTLESLGKLVDESAYVFVVEDQGRVVAFLITVAPGADYHSVNYQWFEKTYDNFLYIDRVVIDTTHHRKGLGRTMYQELIEIAKGAHYPRITAEIDILPENPVSLAFHKGFGFQEVGKQMVAGGKKQVSLQAVELM